MYMYMYMYHVAHDVHVAMHVAACCFLDVQEPMQEFRLGRLCKHEQHLESGVPLAELLIL